MARGDRPVAGGRSDVVKGTYIRFRMIENPPGAKTHSWWVETKNGVDCLGIISWYGGWRKYTFRSESGSEFEEICLREIAQFITDRTAEHKAKRRGET
jgi:hypothetical protein